MKISLRKIFVRINCLGVQSTCFLVVLRRPQRQPAAVHAANECVQSAQLEEGRKRSAQ